MMPKKTVADGKLEEAIRKYVLLNAYTHEGKAQPQAVLGKILAELPEQRVNASQILEKVKEGIKGVAGLSLDDQRKLIEAEWPSLLDVKERKVERKELPPLPNVEKYEKVVTRFSPNPDCVLHMGSARAIVLSWSYAKMYDGEFYLRFEDTDPKVKRPVLEFYDSIRDDLKWLGCAWDKEFIQSDRIDVYYSYAEKLLAEGHAYVCTCKSEFFREMSLSGKPCLCRDLSGEEHVKRWRDMLDGNYDEGEAVVRVKTDLSHPNPAVRDWPALRIVNSEKTPHPRVGSKYRVWPLYNFSCGLDDHLMGVTHIIRGKEHLTNEQRQRYLYSYLGWEYPSTIHYGRLKITGAVLSKSKLKAGVEEGIYQNYSDPRLATFQALRRRGFTPNAIKDMMYTVGPKTADVTLSWETLYSFNRKVVESTSNRYFFVGNPIPLTVREVSGDWKVKLPLHPDHPDRGCRVIDIHAEGGEVDLLLAGSDLKLLTPRALLRLKGLFNIEVEKVSEAKVTARFRGASHEEAMQLHVPVVHFLPAKDGIPAKIFMPDGSVVKGIAETACAGLKAPAVVQFERFGFVRVEDIGKELVAYYAHK
jgi:glutamyl-tRNA synthetase